MKEKLIKRLQWYYPTERNFAYAFSIVLIYLVIKYPTCDQLLLWYGLAVMVVVLFQGQYYWLLKLRKLEGVYFEETAPLALFKKCQRINWILIALMPVCLGWQLYLNEDRQADTIYQGWALAANGFAISEHINYYYYQLMIDTKSDLAYVIHYRGLKRSSLYKDLKENQF